MFKIITFCVTLIIANSCYANPLIKQLEGFRHYTYKCEGGTQTIGYGTSTGIKGTLWVSEAKASKMLEDYLNKYVRPVMKRHIKIYLTKKEKMALESFIYNIGYGAFKKSKALVYLNQGDWTMVRLEMLKWKYVKGKYSLGLYRRRLTEISYLR